LEKQRSALRWLDSGVAVLWTALILPSAWAAPDEKVDALRHEAELAEKAGQWEKACYLYDQLLTKHRSLPEVRERFRTCLRHANLLQRHRDQTYRQQVLSQDQRVIFRIYREVVTKLRAIYVEPDRTDFTRLFQFGLDELLLALEEEVFRKARLPATIGPAAVQAFRAQLRESWCNVSIHSQHDLEAEVFKVAQAARKALKLDPVVTVMEFACGACNGLDEHTLYLTPGQLSDVYAALEGETVGVGIQIAIIDRKVIITEVVMGSAAALEGLKPQDEITRIDKKSLENLSDEVVTERLEGPAGSLVELEVLAMGETRPRTVVLTRQLTRAPSVVQAQLLPSHPDLGYLRILSFQKNTVQELDEALLQLRMQGMKALIMDLRGNWGGIFPVALQVAERFLPEGKVIVSTQSQLTEQVRRYQANYPGSLDIPVVILVDGETASAAEVVAGALQENDRAKLVGQATYGKWSIQRVLQLENSKAGGLRITLARFLSPSGKDYNLTGVLPNFLETPSLSMTDNQLVVAISVANQLLGMRQ
jgi:carboxyl-terminal processing protease